MRLACWSCGKYIDLGVATCGNCGAPFNEKMSKAVAPRAGYYLLVAGVYAIEAVILLFVLAAVFTAIETSKTLEERKSTREQEATPIRSPSPTPVASPYRRR